MGLMNVIVRQKLVQVNRDFYDQFADAFASTRYGVQGGWERIIPQFAKGCQVLDLGCGNGRFARFLDSRVPTSRYVGLDASAGLIKIARAQASQLEQTQASFMLADLAAPGWSAPCQWNDFDVVVSLAVMHHIPSFETRSSFLRAATTCLGSDGVVILSNWRFAHNQRMRRKIVPWETLGLNDADVEPGDYLLDWKREGTGYRYAHQVDEPEIVELAQLAGLDVVEQFYADGKEGDLSLYSVLIPSARQP